MPASLRALREARRVLRRSGHLLLFDHVRSRDPALHLKLAAMTLVLRRKDTAIGRRTLETVVEAGFEALDVSIVVFDIILSIRARRGI